MKTINEVYDSIGQIFVEMEYFYYGDGVSVTRAERMTHIDRAYNHAGEALDGLEVLRGKLTPRAFEEVDNTVDAARKALWTVTMKTRPMNLDLNDEFFEEVERFVQAFILEHNEQLRSVCDRLYRHTEGTVIADMEAPPVEVQHGWTWEQLRRNLMGISGMTASNAANWRSRGNLVEITPGVYTVESCEAVLERAHKPRKNRTNGEDYDPLDVK